jgi:hypothetical protein
MPWNVGNFEATPAYLKCDPIQKRIVGLNAEKSGVGRVNADRHTQSAAYYLERACVVRVGVGKQDEASRRVADGGQNDIRFGAGVHDGELSCDGAAKQVTVHRPGTDFHAFQVQIHYGTPLRSG